MIISKIANLCEMLQWPGGLRLKFAERSFSLGDFRVCNRLKSSGVFPEAIYDVGANIGQFALSAANIWPGVPIFSFEPVPSAFGELVKLAARYPAIHPIPMALGAEAGTAVMHVTNQTQSSSLLKLHRNHLEMYPEIRESETREVQVGTLAAQLNAISSPPPRLLKLDVQGFEAAVIRGAEESLKEFRWILLETATRPMYKGEVLFGELCEILAAQGFRFVSPFYIHFSKKGAIGQFDALFETTQRPDVR
ncbi:MAG: FkbM family methyltransferase [Verrucomicrobiota bacterium]